MKKSILAIALVAASSSAFAAMPTISAQTIKAEANGTQPQCALTTPITEATFNDKTGVSIDMIVGEGLKTMISGAVNDSAHNGATVSWTVGTNALTETPTEFDPTSDTIKVTANLNEIASDVNVVSEATVTIICGQ